MKHPEIFFSGIFLCDKLTELEEREVKGIACSGLQLKPGSVLLLEFKKNFPKGFFVFMSPGETFLFKFL